MEKHWQAECVERPFTGHPTHHTFQISSSASPSANSAPSSRLALSKFSAIPYGLQLRRLVGFGRGRQGHGMGLRFD